MVPFLKFIAGCSSGFVIVVLFIWLVFAYPYSEVQLEAYWWGLGIGVLVTAIVLMFFGYYLGPMD